MLHNKIMIITRIENPIYKRLPRKLKKELKSKIKNRYNIEWHGAWDLWYEYYWFYHNPLNYNMNEKLWKKNPVWNTI